MDLSVDGVRIHAATGGRSFDPDIPAIIFLLVEPAWGPFFEDEESLAAVVGLADLLQVFHEAAEVGVDVLEHAGVDRHALGVVALVLC